MSAELPPDEHAVVPDQSLAADNIEGDGDAGLSRKERKKLEKERLFAAELQRVKSAAENVGRVGDSPFSVTVEQDSVPEGSRNISLNKVSVSVNGKVLFRDTAVKLSAGSRYGLMGPNGRGKSTLLRLLKTRELPVQKSLNILLVEQEQEITGGDTPAVQVVLQSHETQQEYMAELEALRTKEELDDDELERLKFLENELQILGADQADAKARRILFGLGFPTEWHDRPTKSFSGGWRKRIMLASAVFIEPDVLMLDEPTNHLDLNAVIWLETYLGMQYNENQKKPKTLVVVSHDAGFLDSVCTHMVHIESALLNYYRGGFSEFDKQLSQRRTELDKKYAIVQKRVQEKKSKGMSTDQANAWLEDQVKLGKISCEHLEKRHDYRVTFPFIEPTSLHNGCIVKLESVGFNYPNCPTLFSNVSVALWFDSRITLCGPNGIGKSTLLNLMTGLLEATEGNIQVNRQVRIGRYNQHFVDKLPLEKRATEFLVQLGCKDVFEARRILGSFGLEGDAHNNTMATLSGGQKARVAFASISVERPHFILFDEPTNHLDVEAIQALCDAIKRFKGGVLVVTHDARLIKETGMQIWIVDNKNVMPFRGELEDYKEKIRREFELKEAKREFARSVKAEDKRSVRNKLPEELSAVEDEKRQREANSIDDFFASEDKKKSVKKKDKKDKKEKKDIVEGVEGEEIEEKRDKREKKDKKDKKDKKKL